VAEASSLRFRGGASVSSASTSASKHTGLRRRPPNIRAEPRLIASSGSDNSVWLRSSPRRPTRSYYRGMNPMTTSFRVKSMTSESTQERAVVLLEAGSCGESGSAESAAQCHPVTGKARASWRILRIRLRRRAYPTTGSALLAGESCGFACGVTQTRRPGLRS
jgi:hypothetical protein